MSSSKTLLMDPAAAAAAAATLATTRRKIPRPWLDRRQLSANEIDQQRQEPQQQRQQWQSFYKSHNHDVTMTTATAIPPFVLLDRPSPVQSFMKLSWCCDPMQEEEEKQQQQYEEQKEDNSIIDQRVVLYSQPILSPPNYNNDGFHPCPNLPFRPSSHLQNQPKPSRSSFPILHPSSSSHTDNSSLFQQNRPTVIYVIQGNPSTVHPPSSTEELNLHLSVGGGGEESHGTLRTPPPPPPPLPMTTERSANSSTLVPDAANRRCSWDHTSMTSLSMDDSFALSTNSNQHSSFQYHHNNNNGGGVALSNNGNTLDGTGVKNLMQQNGRCEMTTQKTGALHNGIPRPPRMSLKSKTLGATTTTAPAPTGLATGLTHDATNRTKTPRAAGGGGGAAHGIPRPPSSASFSSSSSSVAKPLSLFESRPPALRARAATTGSATSTNSLHRRQERHFVMDQRLFQSITKEDRNDDDEDKNDYNYFDYNNHDDDDDCSTLPSSCGDDGNEDESQIFPLLLDHAFHDFTITSPRSQDTEQYEPEVYLPKCQGLDTKNDTLDVVLSGWVAFSMGEDNLSYKQCVVSRKNIGYLTVSNHRPNELWIQTSVPPMPSSNHPSQNRTTTTTNTTTVYSNKNSQGQGTGETDHEESTNYSSTVKIIPLPSNVSVQTVESQGGRSIVLSTYDETAKCRTILCTFMPLNLPPGKFCSMQGKLLSKSSLPPHAVVVPHASVEQHDAALFLWFGLDGWIRQGNKNKSRISSC